jgi:hypothetical protein
MPTLMAAETCMKISPRMQPCGWDSTSQAREMGMHASSWARKIARVKAVIVPAVAQTAGACTIQGRPRLPEPMR